MYNKPYQKSGSGGGWKGKSAGGSGAWKGKSAGTGGAGAWKPKSFAGRASDSKDMHSATCSQCGNSCQVPFKPNGKKPIFCSNCFKRDGEEESYGAKKSYDRPERGGRDDRRPSYERSDRPVYDGSQRAGTSADEKRMYQTECGKCGAACQVPFRPTGIKPTFCSTCFGNSIADGNKATELFTEELKKVNAKLDAIMKAMSEGAE